MTDVGFQGSGCAISKASASLMTDSIKGRPVAEVRDAVPAVPHDGDDAARRAGGGHGQALGAGRRARVPVRVKCASLAWHTLKAALDREQLTSTE